MESRNDYFGRIFHPRSEGVGHVCVESFPLVKGFRIAGGGGEGGGRLNWRADCGSSRERFRASQPQSSSELPFGARRLLT